MGLALLGHDVWFIEDSDDYPSCYDPSRHVVDTNPSFGLGFAQQAFDTVGLRDRWAYYDAHTGRWHGPFADHIAARGLTADLLLNVSGVNPLRRWALAIPHRAFIDTDPAFTQIRHLVDASARARAACHTAFLSFGENVGGENAAMPQDGLPWRSTRQPIVLTAWPVRPGPGNGRFTTVMQWESYPARTYKGRHYGLKSASFVPFIDLPRRSGHRFELALGGQEAPREELRAQGWRLCDPLQVTRDPWTYQRYIQRSMAEFSVAKHGYVMSRSGWFSERSAAYLASGRPVVVQDTGFSEWLHAAGGVLPFTTPNEAMAALDDVSCHYDHHCRMARAVAEEYFDSRMVLTRLIEDAMRTV